MGVHLDLVKMNVTISPTISRYGRKFDLSKDTVEMNLWPISCVLLRILSSKNCKFVPVDAGCNERI